MQDYVIRGTTSKGDVRAFAAVTTNIVKEARAIHDMSPTASAALGRTMTAAAMMSRLLKNENDTLTIQVRGDGPLKGLVVVSNSSSDVRGYVYNPDVYIPLNEKGKLDVSGAIGKGYLNVIVDLGLKEPYIGYVDLVSGEIAEDIAYYYAKSEQVPSVVAIGVLVDTDGSILNSGGYIIQLMPDADEEIIEFLERKIPELPPVTSLLEQGKTPEDILELILGEKGFKVMQKSECRYKCNCSRERMEKNLLSLGKKEIMAMINDQDGAEVNCHFCNQTYNFSAEELMDLLEESERQL